MADRIVSENTAAPVSDERHTDTDPFCYLGRFGIEEAEMYARHAEEIVGHLFERPAEENISAVQALIEKSRRIMLRLVEEELHPKPAAGAGTPARAVVEEAPPRGFVISQESYNKLSLHLASARDLIDVIGAETEHEDALAGVITVIEAAQRELEQSYPG